MPGAARRGNARSALATLVLALAATLFALVCVELGLRVAERFAAPPPPIDPELAALPELTTFLDVTRPDVRGRYAGQLWRTNSAGMRGPEAAREPTPGTFRIALFGDSFVAGAGVAEEQTYGAQLERLLAESGGSARFEVLNFGQPGLNARTVATHARDIGRYFRSSLYVYGVTLNDIFEPGEELVAAPPPPDPDAPASWPARFDSRLWRALRPHWVALRELFVPNAYTQLVLRGYRDPEKLARLAHAMSELSVLGARDGACVHVFTHTELSALRFGHPFGAVYGQIERTARDAGASASSSYPAFRGRDSTPLRLSADDGHPNAEGHRILAGALYDALRALPPDCHVPPLPARGDS